MDFVSVEIILISARDLDILGFNTAYAIAWISDYITKQQTTVSRTAVDRVNGTNPTWNYSTRFTLNNPTLKQGCLVLEIAICTETPFGDVEIGCVHIPLKHFVEPGCAKFITIPFQTYSQNPMGILNIRVNTEFSNQPEQQPYSHLPYCYPTYLPPHQQYPPTSPPSLHPLQAQPQPQLHGYLRPGYPALPPRHQQYTPPSPPFQAYPSPYQGYQPVVPQPYRPSMLSTLADHVADQVVSQICDEAVSQALSQVDLGDGFY